MTYITETKVTYFFNESSLLADGFDISSQAENTTFCEIEDIGDLTTPIATLPNGVIPIHYDTSKRSALLDYCVETRLFDGTWSGITFSKLHQNCDTTFHSEYKTVADADITTDSLCLQFEFYIPRRFQFSVGVFTSSNNKKSNSMKGSSIEVQSNVYKGNWTSCTLIQKDYESERDYIEGAWFDCNVHKESRVSKIKLNMQLMYQLEINEIIVIEKEIKAKYTYTVSTLDHNYGQVDVLFIVLVVTLLCAICTGFSLFVYIIKVSVI